MQSTTTAHLPANASAVAEARRRFKANRPGRSWEFDFFLRKFSVNESMGAIATELGRTLAAVYVTRKTYFAALFPEQPKGHARIELRTRARIQREMFNFQGLHDYMSAVVYTARRHGLKTRRVEMGGKGWRGWSKDRLWIGGHLCEIHYCRSPIVRPGGRASVLNYGVSLANDSEYVIFMAFRPRRFFIVPTKELLQSYKSRGPAKPQFHVYPPILRRPLTYRGPKPKMDLWSYRNRWDQLRPRETT